MRIVFLILEQPAGVHFYVMEKNSNPAQKLSLLRRQNKRETLFVRAVCGIKKGARWLARLFIIRRVVKNSKRNKRRSFYDPSKI